jgi:hypothetical protein
MAKHLCACGCGLPTRIATRNRKDRGWVKGHHLKYLTGHSARRPVHIGAPGTVWCCACKTFKRKRYFATCRRKRNGLQSICKKCSGLAAKHYRQTHLQRLKNTHLKHRLKRFGITPEYYDSLLLAQKGVCAICGGKEKRKLAVDHDHSTNKIRGLLCTRCNNGLGAFRDNIVLLNTAIVYINKNRSLSI